MAGNIPGQAGTRYGTEQKQTLVRIRQREAYRYCGVPLRKADSGAITGNGRSTLIDEEKFFEWLRSRGAQA